MKKNLARKTSKLKKDIKHLLNSTNKFKTPLEKWLVKPHIQWRWYYSTEKKRNISPEGIKLIKVYSSNKKHKM